ncbi:MAG: CHAP domain-containing protein [Micrococcales bacterium]|nr:CHAP domain-containing protein [Micrococcales bacterium]
MKTIGLVWANRSMLPYLALAGFGLVVVALVLPVAILAGIFGAAASSPDGVEVPLAYYEDILDAGSKCEAVDPALLSAVLVTVSGWDPAYEGPNRAQGLAQLDPPVWSAHATAQWADPLDPPAAIHVAGIYLCELHRTVRQAIENNRDAWRDDEPTLMVGAYLRGWATVNQAKGITDKTAMAQVTRILRLANDTFAYMNSLDAIGLKEWGATPGARPGGAGLTGDDYPETWRARCCAGCGNSPLGYAWGNCTDFAAWRLTSQAGLGADQVGGLGNGGQWGENAAAKGWRVDQVVEPGSIAYRISGRWGHVAWVAQVKPDGSYLVEEYNVLRCAYSTRLLANNSTAFDGFIHPPGQTAAPSITPTRQGGGR